MDDKLNEIKGNGSHKVLFLHGFNSNKKFVFPLVSKHREYSILSFDFPTKTTEEFNYNYATIESFTLFAQNIIDTINEPFTIVGHSLGGAIAMGLKSKFIKNKILLCPLNPFSETERVKDWLLPNDMKQSLESISSLFNGLNKELSNNLDFISSTFLRDINTKRGWYQKMVLEEICNPLYIKSNLYETYKNNENKTLLIQGDKDLFIKNESSKNTSREFNFGYLELKNAGHSLLHEKPTEINELLNKIVTNE
ncbi:alpha/beta fold hydrolase [Mycoplasma marinum]|uniref:alpha/beta fold hydrolase n=1 Tax=Mycoplasma marinum TaxID=1937190 RepID=UPI003B2EFAFA